MPSKKEPSFLSKDKAKASPFHQKIEVPYKHKD